MHFCRASRKPTGESPQVIALTADVPLATPPGFHIHPDDFRILLSLSTGSHVVLNQPFLSLGESL